MLSNTPSPASGTKETWTLTYNITQADIDAGLSFAVDAPTSGHHGNASVDNLIISQTTVNNAGSVTEIADGVIGENTDILSDSGTLDFGDVDLSDSHTVSVSSNGTGYLGAMNAVVSDAATGDGAGELTWTYAVADSAVDYLAAGEILTQSYDVTVDDGAGGSVTETVTVTLLGSNDAVDDSFSGDEDTQISGNVLTDDGIDTDVDGDTLAVTAETVTSANGGTVVITSDGAFTYDPVANFFGSDSFSYTVTDGNGGSDTATVTVNVADVPDSSSVTTQALFIGNYGGGATGAVVITSFVDSNGDGMPDTPLDPDSNTTLAADANNDYGSAYGDLDGDGDIDLVVASHNQVTMYFNEGDTNGDGSPEFYSLVLSSPDVYSGTNDVAVADFDGNGIDDVIVSGYSGASRVFFGQGDVNNDGTITRSDYATPISLTNAAGYNYGITTADLNGDGNQDIIKANWSSGPIEIHYGDGAGGFSHDIIEDAYDEYTLGVDVGDVNGDGRNDILAARWSNQNDIVYYNQGDTDGDGSDEFIGQVVHSGGYNLEGELFDLDDDGDLDIVFSSYSDATPVVLVNDGVGGFTEIAMPSAGASASGSYGIGVGDIDNDGDIDIIQTNTNGVHDVFLNQGGTDGALWFTNTTLTSTPSSWDATFINLTDDFVFV